MAGIALTVQYEPIHVALEHTPEEYHVANDTLPPLPPRRSILTHRFPIA